MNFQQALLTSEEYLEYLSAKGEFFSHEQPPEVVIIIQQKVALSHLLSEHSHHFGKGIFSKLAWIDRSKVGVCGSWGLGGSSLAIQLELLILWGVKKIIMIDIASRLTDRIRVHQLVFAKEAEGIDGVSGYYHQEQQILLPFELETRFELYAKKEGMFIQEASVLSSDLFFRVKSEDSDENHSYKDLLDMNTAVLYSIAKKREIEAISLLITADCLAGFETIVGFDPEKVVELCKKGADLAMAFGMDWVD